MAEGVGDGHWAVGVEAWLLHHGVGDGDWTVPGVAPVAAVLAAAENIVKYLVKQWPCVKGDGCAEQIECRLHNRKGAPLACVGVVDAAGAHVERKIVACFPTQGAAIGRAAQERHRCNRVELLINVVLAEGVERQAVIETERGVAKYAVIVPRIAVKVIFAPRQACCDLEALAHRHGEGYAGACRVAQARVGRVRASSRKVTATHTADDA